MFRYEIGAKILVKRREDTDYEPIQVEILAKARNTIKVKVLSGGWFPIGAITILTSYKWFSVGRLNDPVF